MKVARSILKTVCYADIFDYPLTLKQLHRRLITPYQLSFEPVKNKAEKLVKKGILALEKGNYCLAGREQTVKLKYQSVQISKQKLPKAKRAAGKLSLIPTILLIGLSGNLAMDNVKKGDDIDLFIVCRQNKLWTTRLLAVVMSEILSQRRRPAETNFADKICLNMFVDETHLALPKKERDLFSAYEVMQMKPLFDRGGVYQRFCRQNQWVLKYLAHAWSDEAGQREKEKKTRAIESDGWLEKWLGIWQRRLMKKRRTNEMIKPGYVRFHPSDARGWILKRYQQNLKKYQV